MTSRFHDVLLFLVGFLAGIVTAFIFAFLFLFPFSVETSVASFDDCVAKGYPILESFPRQCRYPDGRMAVEPILLEETTSSSFSPIAESSSSSSRNLLVFFGNENRNPNAQDCSLTYAVERVTGGRSDVARAALELLFQGPTEGESTDGFYTSLPAGVTIRSVDIRDGIARVEFDEALERGVGGSCRVAAIRAQIAQTLMQFPTVDDVIISVDGRVEDVLQP